LGRLTWQVGEVVEIVPETERVKSVRIDVPGWRGHRAGQHVDLRLTAEDGYQAVRSYSLASASEAGAVTLTVERLEDGEVSPFLVDELRSGDRLELRGPVGGYFVWGPDDGGPLLLVGGGSGVVPLMAMIRQRGTAGSSTPVRLIYSSRSQEEIIYRGELERRAADEQALELIYTLTRSQPDGWTGYRRRIDADLLHEVGWRAAERPLAFVCGSTGLVESVATALLELGYEAARIRTERFGPTGGNDA
jgi:ferredoxin-NADP reductase